MRPAALLLTALALAACGTTEQAAQPAATPAAAAAATSEPAPTSTPPPALAKPELTDAEAAYMDALQKAFVKAGYVGDGETLSADSYVQQGHEYCDTPPTLAAVLEGIADKQAEEWQAAIRHLCPKYLPVLTRAATAFSDGVYTVGEDIKPGTYRTVGGRVTRCFWERSTPGGDTIDNDYVVNAPRGVRVTLRAGEGFTSRRCGVWVRA